MNERSSNQAILGSMAGLIKEKMKQLKSARERLLVN